MKKYDAKLERLLVQCGIDRQERALRERLRAKQDGRRGKRARQQPETA